MASEVPRSGVVAAVLATPKPSEAGQPQSHAHRKADEPAPVFIGVWEGVQPLLGSATASVAGFGASPKRTLNFGLISSNIISRL